MHVLGMTKHTRQILAKGEKINTPFIQNVVSNTPGDDRFSSENAWQSSFQSIDTHPVIASIMSTQLQHTIPCLLDLKIFLDCHLTPQITP